MHLDGARSGILARNWTAADGQGEEQGRPEAGVVKFEMSDYSLIAIYSYI